MTALGDWGPLDPEEIASKRFHTVWRGWDVDEVRDFLERVAAEHEAALHDARRWRALVHTYGLDDVGDHDAA